MHQGAPSNGVTEKAAAITGRMFCYRSLVEMRGRGDTRIFRSRICPKMATRPPFVIVHSYTILI